MADKYVDFSIVGSGDGSQGNPFSFADLKAESDVGHTYYIKGTKAFLETFGSDTINLPTSKLLPWGEPWYCDMRSMMYWSLTIIALKVEGLFSSIVGGGSIAGFSVTAPITSNSVMRGGMIAKPGSYKGCTFESGFGINPGGGFTIDFEDCVFAKLANLWPSNSKLFNAVNGSSINNPVIINFKNCYIATKTQAQILLDCPDPNVTFNFQNCAFEQPIITLPAWGNNVKSAWDSNVLYGNIPTPPQPGYGYPDYVEYNINPWGDVRTSSIGMGTIPEIGGDRYVDFGKSLNGDGTQENPFSYNDLKNEVDAARNYYIKGDKVITGSIGGDVFNLPTSNLLPWGEHWSMDARSSSTWSVTINASKIDGLRTSIHGQTMYFNINTPVLVNSVIESALRLHEINESFKGCTFLNGMHVLNGNYNVNFEDCVFAKQNSNYPTENRLVTSVNGFSGLATINFKNCYIANKSQAQIESECAAFALGLIVFNYDNTIFSQPVIAIPEWGNTAKWAWQYDVLYGDIPTPPQPGYGYPDYVEYNIDPWGEVRTASIGAGTVITNGYGFDDDYGSLGYKGEWCHSCFSANPISGRVPLEVNFTALDNEQFETSLYTWTFGDGNSSTGTELSSTTNTYNEVGEYVVSLLIENNDPPEYFYQTYMSDNFESTLDPQWNEEFILESSVYANTQNSACCGVSGISVLSDNIFPMLKSGNHLGGNFQVEWGNRWKSDASIQSHQTFLTSAENFSGGITNLIVNLYWADGQVRWYTPGKTVQTVNVPASANNCIQLRIIREDFVISGGFKYCYDGPEDWRFFSNTQTFSGDLVVFSDGFDDQSKTYATFYADEGLPYQNIESISCSSTIQVLPNNIGHIGSFYFGSFDARVSATTLVITDTILTPSINNASNNIVVVSLPMKEINTILQPRIIGSYDVVIDFVGIPRVGTSPLIVDFDALVTFGGNYQDKYKVTEYRWYFDYEKSPLVYETSLVPTIEHIFKGYAGQKFDVRLEVDIGVK
jgi:hypothetical protein